LTLVGLGRPRAGTLKFGGTCCDFLLKARSLTGQARGTEVDLAVLR
jgi:hypothetical protein